MTKQKVPVRLVVRLFSMSDLVAITNFEFLIKDMTY